MDVQIIASGSKGNCYRADNILIEPGIPIKQIKKALNYKLSNIVACLCGHSHLDHACAAKDIMKSGVELYCSQDTANELGLSGHRLHILEPLKQFQIGHWKIKAFPLVHDVPCLGFLLAKDDEKLICACDTSYIPQRFKGLTHVMLGVSYDTEILLDNILCGHINPEVGKRILKFHMSLDTAKGFFRANDMSKVEEVHLIHLSEANSHAEKFKKEIQQIIGKPVYLISDKD